MASSEWGRITTRYSPFAVPPCACRIAGFGDLTYPKAVLYNYYVLRRAHSSVAEPPAHNRVVRGSNPRGPTFFFSPNLPTLGVDVIAGDGSVGPLRPAPVVAQSRRIGRQMHREPECQLRLSLKRRRRRKPVPGFNYTIPHG